MTDPRLIKLADLLTNYCVAVQPGERVVIMGAGVASPLIRETYRQVIRAGGQPMVQMVDDELQEILYQHSRRHKYARPQQY